MLGGEKAFLPSRWKAGIRPGDPNQWAIPIVVDPRVLYYRRDLLAKAGIAEEGAFTTSQDFARTVQRLHESGVKVPWLAGVDRFAVLHRVASLIWAHGGGIFAPDGRRVAFHEEEALDAMRLYFQMVQRYRAVPESPEAMRQMLLDGKAAVIIENAFLLFTPAPPEIGCAPIPGGSYVGGSDLIIWNHTRNEYASLELVRYLTQPDVAARLLPESYYLPARMDYLNELANRPDPIAATIGKAVLNGRTFPCVPMIGLIEDRLGTALYSIQQEILSNPPVDVDDRLEKLLQQRIVSLGKRTNLSLGGLH
jgi:ABC-type glycerol-3-phosphate transport system substrate-binding protein